MRRHPQLVSFVVVVAAVFATRAVLDVVAPGLPWVVASVVSVVVAAVLGSVVARRLGAGTGPRRD